ncbi:MAG: ABC transporter ATP-binding protein [Thermoprotei archaeon]
MGKVPEERSEEPLLVVKDLRIWYPIRKFLSIIGYVKAVDGVSFEVKRGEIFGVVGESGCGKTTLGKGILRLVEPTSGHIYFEGQDITHIKGKKLKWYRRVTGIVQQDPYGAMPPFMTIKTILEEPLKIHGVPKKERMERILQALEEVKLTPPEDYINKYPHMLSGGQLQRVAIARAFILRPKLVVADEPVSMLDASVRVETLTLFKELQRKYRISVIYITHDFSTAKYFSDRIAVMYAGHIVELGPARDVIYKPKHPYAQHLIKVIPDPDPQNRFVFKETLPGEPPSLVNPPPGCRLAPRCPHVMDICKTKEPPMVEVEPNHYVKCWLYVKR